MNCTCAIIKNDFLHLPVTKKRATSKVFSENVDIFFVCDHVRKGWWSV